MSPFISAAIAMLCHPWVVAATCPGNLGPSTTPTSDYVVNSDGTVTHSPTGLMWKRCVEGQSGASCSTGSATELNWPAALSAARNSTFAGYTDWRLPNKKELESLVDTTCHNPAINDTVFPATFINGWTWTSTTLDFNPAAAWIVDFGDGNSNAALKTVVNHAIRLVRGGQSFDALSAIPTQTLTFGAAPALVVGGTASVSATSANPNSGNPISYSSLTPTVCSVNSASGVVSALAVGTCTIAANQAGNASYSAAVPVSLSFTVAAAPVVVVAQPVPSIGALALGFLAFLMLALGVSFTSEKRKGWRR